MNRIGLLMLCGALAAASSAMAQTAGAPPCAGQWQVIRVSKIKPGQMAGFMDAVKDQQAWYAGHGLKDRIMVGRMLEATGYSADTAVTIHDKVDGPASPPHEGDAKWNAFVAKFRASSDIVAGGPVCVTVAPK